MSDEIVIDDRAGKPPRTWDFFLTVFLLLMLVVMTGIFVVSGLAFGVTTLSCADSAQACNGLAISVGAILAILGTPMVAIAGITVSIIWIARRKISSLVAFISVLACAGVFMLGGWLVELAVPA